MNKDRNPIKLRIDNLLTFDAMTEGQEKIYQAWRKGDNVVLSGTAGTGKTFCALYLALELVLDKGTRPDKIILCRSIVPTRQIGFLPGTEDEKLEVYAAPYKAICAQLFNDVTAYDKLVAQGVIEFVSTSHLRGMTYDDSVIIVDEMQNLNGHELDSIMTRVGENSKIMFCGDYIQTDLTKEFERSGLTTFLSILDSMSHFTRVDFTWEDIVRSGLVREYLMTKAMMKVERF